jgi:hypothetical protein
MAISIGGTVVIDDGRNIVNANDIRVGLVTVYGSTGNIETPGTIIANNIDIPYELVSLSPTDGATGVVPNTTTVITFNQFVQKATTGIGTTANITFRSGSAVGTVLKTIGVSSTSVQVDRTVVTITVPAPQLPYNTNLFVVIDEGAFQSLTTSTPLIDTYNFTTKPIEPGDNFGGGFVMCSAASVRWIVSPISAEVSRTWYLRNDANTLAQQVSGCTGWFIPSCAQLQNPGYVCRDFWGPSPCYSSALYWSNTEPPPRGDVAFFVNFTNGVASAPIYNKSATQCVRSFRCVTY